MKVYPIVVLCRVMRVSRSGFYDYLRRGRVLGRQRGHAVLEARMRAIFDMSRGSYGSRRMVHQLRLEGHRVGRYKVRRLMRQLGLVVKTRRRFKVTTDSVHQFPVADNILNRQFTAEAPNTTWVSDITYVWTMEGWLYLAVIMDLYSRLIVGWAMDKRLHQPLTLDALAMAYGRRTPDPGLLHHSDRGRQYASHDYQERMEQYGMIASMSRKGDCWDNAPAERFFGSLKTERLDGLRFQKRDQARFEILDYISYYNAIRLHSALGYLSPMDYEAEQKGKAA